MCNTIRANDEGRQIRAGRRMRRIRATLKRYEHRSERRSAKAQVRAALAALQQGEG